ncbi:hypothetical protein [Venatoribacter cucullus]|uniref:Uncharacterized protein n=1 Tax=Venatoribacter cucullus TaxID=2661630 RepID=A0A9E8FJ04_9GAMM|nr:hypothetical protein [Venatoribacter cucullus]QQD20657.1 hypothetical protein GJQ54_02240 [Oceanospirillaceae bacterium ASx5O]QQD23362.1 hypothetical protein GJQ55_02205 [Venatoribacter cucullus]UZK02794.1 hypothetical protein GAY96_02195 [Venatoribacter cucullus]
MQHPLPVAPYSYQTGNVVTLLSDRVMIPITCDHCQQQTDVSLGRLKQQTIFCRHCHQARQFSSLELRLMRMLLAQEGYHFAL